MRHSLYDSSVIVFSLNDYDSISYLYCVLVNYYLYILLPLENRNKYLIYLPIDRIIIESCDGIQCELREVKQSQSGETQNPDQDNNTTFYLYFFLSKLLTSLSSCYTSIFQLSNLKDFKRNSSFMNKNKCYFPSLIENSTTCFMLNLQ